MVFRTLKTAECTATISQSLHSSGPLTSRPLTSTGFVIRIHREFWTSPEFSNQQDEGKVAQEANAEAKAISKKITQRFCIKRIQLAAFWTASNEYLKRLHPVPCKFLEQSPDCDCRWDQFVEIAGLNHNSLVQESTKHTSHEVVFGKLVRIPSAESLRGRSQSLL
ncbi:hypothetical protein QAD02_001016 [Eretmocerus hayati]|uniref:Uncharacterized protein n=1 Tax=Eretmocerus hayati TaxID=131215 RepID=A0ACC2NF74_9HYME|nr:hypothetical protein QAD02_001016 [Eretmocerus hayati]